MKKFLTMAVIFCTLVMCSIVNAAAKVTDARWGVDKNNVLRLVVDITESTHYEMKMSDFNKLNLIVDASANANLFKTTSVRSSLANSMRVYEEGKKTIVELALTRAITEKDYRSFVLKKDPANNRPQRIVMDITADKKEPAATPVVTSVATVPVATTKTPVVVSTKPTNKRPQIIKSQTATVPVNTEAVSPKTETANASTAKAEGIKNDIPVVEASKTEPAKVETPVAQTTKVETTAVQAPKSESTKVEATKKEETKTAVKKADKRTDIKVTAKDKKPSEKATAPKKEPGIPAIKATRKYTVGGGIKGKTIVLDAGHGGSDPGAIGASGFKEKEATLAITKLLKQELEDKGAKVYMTRTTDVDVCKPGASDRDELQARVNVAEKNNCDAFISIHINASVNKSVGGFSTYYHPKTDYDLQLARNIQNNLAKNFKINDLGVREAGFYVIKRSSMPAVLCELLFISNPKEEKLLQNGWFRKKSARMIADGIENYFK